MQVGSVGLINVPRLPVKELAKHVLRDVVGAVQVEGTQGGCFSTVHPLQEMR